MFFPFFSSLESFFFAEDIFPLLSLIHSSPPTSIMLTNRPRSVYNPNPKFFVYTCSHACHVGRPNGPSHLPSLGQSSLPYPRRSTNTTLHNPPKGHSPRPHNDRLITPFLHTNCRSASPPFLPLLPIEPRDRKRRHLPYDDLDACFDVRNLLVPKLWRHHVIRGGGKCGGGLGNGE